LKAPAGHEPAVPDWVDTVVVVAGLSGLGQRLDETWVHRPEKFAALAGLPPGSRITPEGLSRVLTDPMGGLKGLPAGARRIALLNQADTPARQAAGNRLAEGLLEAYASVLVAALDPPPHADQGGLETKPDGSPGPVIAVHEPIAGIVLAGGESSRLGQPKQLLAWRGEPFVRQAARLGLVAGLAPVIVVTGAQAESVTAVLQDLPVQIVHNPSWSAGQSTSIQAGLKALRAWTGGAVFLLVDQPHVPPGLVRSLVELHSLTLAPVVAPQADGRRANPVLFDRRTFPELLALSGETGGRALFSRYSPAWLPWHDASILLDVDTLEDYARLLSLED
jgi:molybdenum cofactor cytidylyltransferase